MFAQRNPICDLTVMSCNLEGRSLPRPSRVPEMECYFFPVSVGTIGLKVARSVKTSFL